MGYTKINECVIAKDLYYAVEDNTWVRVHDDGTVYIGMTDIAQSLAGPILHAKAKPVGKARKKGRPIATVESGKWVGPIKTPISGEIVEVNEELAADVQLLNKSPYNKGWVVRMQPDNLEEELKDMVTGDEAVLKYKEKIERDGIEACAHIEGTDSYEEE